jgi:hypothetical protein
VKQAGKSRVGRIEILLVIAKTNPEFVVLDLEVNSGYIDAKHAQYACILISESIRRGENVTQ